MTGRSRDRFGDCAGAWPAQRPKPLPVRDRAGRARTSAAPRACSASTGRWLGRRGAARARPGDGLFGLGRAARQPTFRAYAPTHFLTRHVLSLGIAFVAALLAFQVPMALGKARALGIRRRAGAAGAVLVPFVGKGVNGARRWIRWA